MLYKKHALAAALLVFWDIRGHSWRPLDVAESLQKTIQKWNPFWMLSGRLLVHFWFILGPPPTRRRPDADLAVNPWPSSPVGCFEQNPSVARALLVFRIWWFRRLGISFAYNFDLSKDCRSDPRGPMLAFQRKGRGPIYPLRDAGRGPFTDCSLLPRSPQDKYQHVRYRPIHVYIYIYKYGFGQKQYLYIYTYIYIYTYKSRLQTHRLEL